jgi:hypothetical protein
MTSLDIYANKSFLTQEFKLLHSGQIELKVPSHVNLSDIQYTLDSKCKITQDSLSKKLEFQSKNSEKIDEISNKIQTLENEKKSLLAKEELLKTLSLKTEYDFKKIEKITEYLTKNISQNAHMIDAIDKQIATLKKELETIEPFKKEYKALHVNYDCFENRANIKITYPFENLNYKPFYEIDANENLQKISIKNRALLMQDGLEDLADIELNLFSYAYNKEVNPHPFYPEYLYKKPEIAYKDTMLASAAPKVLTRQNIAQEKTSVIELEELSTQYVYKIKNITLGLAKPTIIDIGEDVYDASFASLIDGYGTNKAYLEATFTPTKEYQRAEAKLSLNSLPIAQRTLQHIQKETPMKLYFGLNQFLHVNKELIKTESQKTFFGNSEIDTQKWRYTLDNKSKKALHVNFLQRAPVSKDGDITVKTIAEPAFTIQSAEGKISWVFELKPDETKEIVFGYEITKKE